MSNSSMNKGHTAGGTPACIGSSAARTDSDFVNYPAPGRHDRPGTCKLPTPRFSLGGDAARKAATGLALSIMAVAMLTGMQAQYGPTSAMGALGGPVMDMDVRYDTQSLPAGNHGEIVSALAASLTDWREANPSHHIELGKTSEGTDFVYFEWVPMLPDGYDTFCVEPERRTTYCVIRTAIYEDAGNGKVQYRNAEQIGNSILDGLGKAAENLVAGQFIQPAPYDTSGSIGTRTVQTSLSSCLKVAGTPSGNVFLPVIPQPDNCLERTLKFFATYKEHPWLRGGEPSTGPVHITRIIDGDTVEQEGGKDIRLALVNTPEREKPGYREATDYTRKLCPTGFVHEFDPDSGQPGGSHGRVIGELMCDNISLNGALVMSGHAEILGNFCSKSEFADEPWAVETCIPGGNMTSIVGDQVVIPPGWNRAGALNESGTEANWFVGLLGKDAFTEGCLLPTSVFVFGHEIHNPLGCVP